MRYHFFTLTAALLVSSAMAVEAPDMAKVMPDMQGDMMADDAAKVEGDALSVSVDQAAAPMGEPAKLESAIDAAIEAEKAPVSQPAAPVDEKVSDKDTDKQGDKTVSGTAAVTTDDKTAAAPATTPAAEPEKLEDYMKDAPQAAASSEPPASIDVPMPPMDGGDDMMGTESSAVPMTSGVEAK